MQAPDTATIRMMFERITLEYDDFNRLSSFGRDKFWRKACLEPVKKGMRVLDLGTGTGDLALGALKRMGGEGEVIGLDFSPKMLQMAEAKRVANHVTQKIRWEERSAESLPFEDEGYDLVLSGFVLRNLYQNIEQILKGVHQSLKPNGTISFVDLTEPDFVLFRWGSKVYLKTVVAMMARYCFRNAHPATYLNESMQRFFRPKGFVKLLEKTGFVDIRAKSFLFGAVTLYQARKEHNAQQV